jgi:hypothetical protein
MLVWVSTVTNKQTAKILDELTRPQITAMYVQHLDNIRRIKEAIDAARIAAGQPPTDDLPVVQPAPLVGPKKRKSA